MNNEPTRKLLSFFRPLTDAEELRPSLLLVVGQVMIAFLGALLITNGLLM